MNMQEFESSIVQNAVSFNVVLFVPGTSSRVHTTVYDLSSAKEFSYNAFATVHNLRAAMVYAIDNQNHHALVGTMNKNMQWKQV